LILRTVGSKVTLPLKRLVSYLNDKFEELLDTDVPLKSILIIAPPLDVLLLVFFVKASVTNSTSVSI
jgi:hypothetical protein